MHRRRPAVALALGTLLFASAAGCGYGSQAGQDALGPDVPLSGPKLSAPVVRIGYFANLTHGTVLVGERQGVIQRALGSTRAEFVLFSAGPDEVEALNAGSIDIGWVGPLPAITGYTATHGRGLRIISGSASGGAMLVVNPARVMAVRDLPGKRIATPQYGNTQDVAFLNWAAAQGWRIDPQSGRGTVSLVRTSNRTVLDAYRNGSIDGAWVPEPTAAQLVALGGKVLVDESSLWPGGQFATTDVIAAQSFLSAHPDVVAAVLRGSVQTNAWIAAHPAAARASANDEIRMLTGKALPPDVIDPAWSSIRFTDDPLAATVNTEVDDAVRAGLLKRPQLSALFDLRLLNRVLAAAGRPTTGDAGLGAH